MQRMGRSGIALAACRMSGAQRYPSYVGLSQWLAPVRQMMCFANAQPIALLHDENI